MSLPKNGYHPGKSVKNNVHAFLEDHLSKNPELEVLRWVDPALLRASLQKGGSLDLPHQTITVRALYTAIDHLSAGFKEIGIGFGDRVILFVPMSLPLYTAMFALQKMGAIPVFLDSWARRNQLGASARVVSPKAMISFEKAFDLVADVPELAQVPLKISLGPTTRSFDGSLEKLMQTAATSEVAPVEQEHTALITFTTGSSGVPKGANRTHRFLAAQHYAINQCIPYLPTDKDLPVFPIFSLNNLAAGVSTVIPAFDIGVPGDHDPQVLLAQFASCSVTCTTLSPSLFNRLSAYCLQNGIQLPQLRRVVTGGAPISRDNILDFQKVAPTAEIWVLYGSTEVEPMADIEGRDMVNQKSRASEDPEWVDEGVNVGKIVKGLRSKFLKIQKNPITIQSAQDWAHLEVPQGEVGELVVAGEHVCRNYYNDEEAFTRAKIMDEAGVVWHRTGDLGRVDSNGYLWIVGRVHNAINRKGTYVFPVRAEMILKKLPFVRLAAYLGVADPSLGEKTVCVVVTHTGNHEEAEKQEITRMMQKNGVPVDLILFRKSIPMDPRHNSKVEYDVLRNELKAAGDI